MLSRYKGALIIQHPPSLIKCKISLAISCTGTGTGSITSPSHYLSHTSIAMYPDRDQRSRSASSLKGRLRWTLAGSGDSRNMTFRGWRGCHLAVREDPAYACHLHIVDRSGRAWRACDKAISSRVPRYEIIAHTSRHRLPPPAPILPFVSSSSSASGSRGWHRGQGLTSAWIFSEPEANRLRK
ncbi:unnamed protein product [Nezara viridula]|uniref:Uncharacterized protein n=1 Tax=Nezara viridula TaxID=85310 RepID=A0A9P0EAF3_NEZVI|nr:unnamed protein product [Nezara viridula]